MDHTSIPPEIVAMKKKENRKVKNLEKLVLSHDTPCFSSKGQLFSNHLEGALLSWLSLCLSPQSRPRHSLPVVVRPSRPHLILQMHKSPWLCSSVLTLCSKTSKNILGIILKRTHNMQIYLIIITHIFVDTNTFSFLFLCF